MTEGRNAQHFRELASVGEGRMTDALDRLQDWLVSRCDGDWEHSAGFQISVLDNPGWSIKLKLKDLGLKIVDPKFVDLRTDDDWISLRIQDGSLRVSCGPHNLREGLNRFLDALAAAEPEWGDN